MRLGDQVFVHGAQRTTLTRLPADAGNGAVGDSVATTIDPRPEAVIEGAVCPIEWESAAAGQGEVDLAALTEYWKPEIVSDCETAYADSRWPEGAPVEFGRILELARMYIHLRWLAVVRQWPTDGTSGRLLRLREIAERMRLDCR